MSAIDTEGLSKSFGELRAVDGLTLSVDAGELYGLLGANGAGKTTAIELLTGQLEPDGGSASVLGRDPAAEPVAVREAVGILPEKEAPPSFLTPREFFQFVGRVRAIDADVREQQVALWSDRLGLGEYLDTLAADLSRGNQQKVMIAAAFLHDPDAVFIDEPLANLDPIVQERVKEALVEYASDNAVVLSTHHVEVAAEICTTVGIVHDGQLVAEREPAALGPEQSLLEEFLAVVEDDHAAAGGLGGSGGRGSGNERESGTERGSSSERDDGDDRSSSGATIGDGGTTTVADRDAAAGQREE